MMNPLVSTDPGIALTGIMSYIDELAGPISLLLLRKQANFLESPIQGSTVYWSITAGQDAWTYSEAIGLRLADSLPKRPLVYRLIFSTPVSEVMGCEHAFSKRASENGPFSYVIVIMRQCRNYVSANWNKLLPKLFNIHSTYWSKNEQQCWWLWEMELNNVFVVNLLPHEYPDWATLAHHFIMSSVLQFEESPRIDWNSSYRIISRLSTWQSWKKILYYKAVFTSSGLSDGFVEFGGNKAPTLKAYLKTFALWLPILHCGYFRSVLWLHSISARLI